MKFSTKTYQTFLLAVAAIFVVGLTACHEKSSTDPKKLEYVKALYSKVLTFDPALMTDTASLSVATQIYDGLLEFDNHFEVRPALAESWETSRDGKTIIFKLRHGIKFHDGSPITSKDCVRSFERLLAPKSVVSKYYDIIVGSKDFQNGKSAHVVGLKAPTSDIFIIELENRFPPFPTVLTGATAKILPSDLVDRPDFFKKPVGAGPFKLEESNDHEVILARFASYWREPAKISKLTFRVLSEKETLDEVAIGKLRDAVTYPLNGDESIFKHGQHLSLPVAATWIIGLNARMKPFDSKTVRQSFKAAFSAEDFTKTFYPGQKPATGGYIPPGLPGYKENPEAKRPIAQTTKKLITLFIPAVLSKAEAMVPYLEKEFNSQGFNVKVVALEWDDFEKRYNDKTMQAFLFSSNADYPDTEFLARNFESDNPDNFSGAHSKKIDGLIKKARTIDSRIERAKVYNELAQVLNDEAYTVNILYYRAHYWFDSCVKGVELNSLGDVYIPYRKISIEGRCGSQNDEVANAN